MGMTGPLLAFRGASACVTVCFFSASAFSALGEVSIFSSIASSVEIIHQLLRLGLAAAVNQRMPHGMIWQRYRAARVEEPYGPQTALLVIHVGVHHWATSSSTTTVPGYGLPPRTAALARLCSSVTTSGWFFRCAHSNSMSVILAVLRVRSAVVRLMEPAATCSGSNLSPTPSAP